MFSAPDNAEQPVYGEVEIISVKLYPTQTALSPLNTVKLSSQREDGV